MRTSIPGWVRRSTLIASALVLWGCPGPTPGPPYDVPKTELPPNHTETIDGEPGPQWVFELGINPAGTNQPQFFSQLSENGELNIEYGPQGAWMVVLAFRTWGLLDGKLYIDGKISVDDVLLGQLKLGQQKLQPAGDGFSYFYNFYLVVNNEFAAGQFADFELLVRDEDEDEVVVERRLLLTGGSDAQ